MSKFIVGKHELQFKCEWGIFKEDGESSVCYCTDEARASLVAQALNEMAERQAAMAEAKRLADARQPPDCPYCGAKSKMVTGADIYKGRPDLSGLLFYRCVPCDATVGINKKTGLPFGRLANRDLRKAKMAAHDAFDPLWNVDGKMTRTEAYAWLSAELGIPPEQCHFGMFDIDTCNKAIAACANKKAVDNGDTDDLPF
jgi:DNA-directed RNA polymerase subunit RPC12/RpoP